MRTRALAFAAAITVAVATLTAAARPAAADKRGAAAEEAKRRTAAAQQAYDEGTKYYSLRDFPRAIENYKKAYELSPNPAFLYNIGQAYRLSRGYDDALFFYKSFLRNAPDADNRAEVERRIAEMQLAVDQQNATAKPPNEVVAPDGSKPPAPEPPPASPPRESARARIPAPDAVPDQDPTTTAAAAPGATERPASRPIYKRWWFWTGVGVVVVGATVAVIASSGGDSDPSTEFGRTDVF
ncbi:MAG: hypothetical protein IT370_21820 [Deltaproteobacteria bacterium]|nr:hypothetical protein [Deltaproteobacteria bacterium]